MTPTRVDTKLRLDWARAMWANLLREGPAHKTPRLVQHLRMLERRMSELEQQLETEAGSLTASSCPNRGELLMEWGPSEVLVSSVRLSD